MCKWFVMELFSVSKQPSASYIAGEQPYLMTISTHGVVDLKYAPLVLRFTLMTDRPFSVLQFLAS